MSETPETDAEAMDGIDCYGDSLKSWDYKASNDGEVVPAEFARKLERERDGAIKERDEARMEFARVREELIASKKVSQGLCARLTEAERERDEARRERNELRKNYLALVEEWKKSVFRLARERDEARRERDEAMKNTDDANRKIERMKNRYAHARKLQRFKTSVMAGVIERYYYLLTSTLDALGLSLEILEPTVKRNMPILAMYIDNLKCKEMEIKEAIGAEASK